MTGKFERNVANDRKHQRELRKLGWKVVTVWSCQLKKPTDITHQAGYSTGKEMFVITGRGRS